MKTIILAVNAKYIHSSLAAWILAAVIPDSVVVETNINQSVSEIAEQVIVCNPDTVAISVYIWNAAILPQVITRIRDNLPRVRIILGGPEATHNAEYWRNYADEIHIGELSQDFIDPYSEVCIAALKGKISYIETSRGCPFSCAFCLSGRSASAGKPNTPYNSVKYLDIDTAKSQIVKLAESESRIIKFVDRTFNCDAARAYDIFEFVIGLDTDKTFHFEVAADLFDARTLDLLSTAPPARIQLEIGLQSFFKPALDASFRKTDLSKATANIRTILSCKNIHVHVDLIAGLPYETFDDFANSFNLAYDLKAHHLQLGFLKLLHGSKMREKYTEITHSPKPPYEITGSPWLSGLDLKVIKRVEYALETTYNKGRFLTALNYALSVSGVAPFKMYRKLGGNACTPERVCTVLEKLPNVDSDKLLEHMICDFMVSQKGVNMPVFMRRYDKSAYKRFRAIAGEKLGRKINRHEVAVLPSEMGVYVDSTDFDAVTGLYRVAII